jgi:hypothetical protein
MVHAGRLKYYVFRRSVGSKHPDPDTRAFEDRYAVQHFRITGDEGFRGHSQLEECFTWRIRDEACFGKLPKPTGWQPALPRFHFLLS